MDISNVMLKNFFIKYPANRLKLFLFLIAFTLSSGFELHSQSLTNLDVFYSLTDSLVDQICIQIPSDEKDILLELNLGQSYSLFSNNIIEQFKQKGKEIYFQSSGATKLLRVDIVIEGAGVEYGEMFRDGFFGTHYVQRYSAIYGNYLLSNSAQIKQDFEITLLDTVRVEDINSLENPSYPFTQAAVSPEPFISGLAEPVIAIGTAALVIVLFFTIRSE